MLGEIFYWIFNMSIASLICGIPILFIRFIKRFPRRYFIFLWLVPFIRMCVPVGVVGKYGIMSLLSEFTTKTIKVFELGENFSFTAMNHVMGADSYFPIIYRLDILKWIFETASVIWIIISFLLIFTFFIIYFTTKNQLKDAIFFKDNVYYSNNVKVPAVYGVVRPKIILPTFYVDRNIDYIIMHENAHIRRRDNLIRIIALIILCFHWFNPFAWLFLKLLYCDMELACDETVLTECSTSQRKEYAKVLLESVEKSNIFVSTLGGAKIKTRIENIVTYRKLSLVSSLALSLFLIALFYVLLTNGS
jgi:beta-lactamase regulating signal transducer with metallopeptidase domain